MLTFSMKIMMDKHHRMYLIHASKQYKKDVRRAQKRGYDIEKLNHVINILASGKALPKEYCNHMLHGTYAGYAECHIQPNWLLIYKKQHDTLMLVLTRTGTHADLFGK